MTNDSKNYRPAPPSPAKKMVWIYVDTNKQVGDVDHLKVFAKP
jgi:hypothetical protein